VSLSLDNMSHTLLINTWGLHELVTPTRHISIPLSYLVWTKVGDGRHWKTPTHLFKPECGVSHNALAQARQWLGIVVVENEDKLTSKNWRYNIPQNTTMCNNDLITEISSNQKKKRRKTTYELHPHSTYKLHNEKPLGFQSSDLPPLVLNLKFTDECSSLK
jgi:hypothetical protein